MTINMKRSGARLVNYMLVAGVLALAITCVSRTSGRLNANDVLDNSFGNLGLTSLNMQHLYSLQSMKVATDGSIYLLSAIYPTFDSDQSDSLIARYHSDGTSDMSFGGMAGLPAGMVVADFQLKENGPLGMAVLNDGKIIVANYVPNLGAVLFRFHANGVLDYSYGQSGKKVVGQIGEGSLIGMDLVDGKIVIWGDESAARVDLNGEFDNSFGVGGVVNFEAEIGQPISVRTVAFADGDMIFGGDVAPGNLPEDLGDGRIFCLDQNGDTKNGFGDNGLISFNSLGLLTKLVVNNQMITAGFFNRVARLDFAGNFDVGFGEGGVVYLDGGVDRAVSDIVLQPTGLTTVSFWIPGGNEFEVARFTSNGSFDETFGNESGWYRQTFGFRTFPTKLFGYPGGKVLMAGAYQAFNESGPFNFMMLRIDEPDVQLNVDPFEGGGLAGELDRPIPNHQDGLPGDYLDLEAEGGFELDLEASDGFELDLEENDNTPAPSVSGFNARIFDGSSPR